ncbi:tumor protein 63-like isoform X1 [Varroa jacobsoni]|uniref:tumor protein 63-like isoform X1 n=1 Tax=Varroa jacobsoni TaxID=62625 RepID=UPI000BF68837|nr:tumor protein 63-like isoform X1 [Varroa jacobsoni]
MDENILFENTFISGNIVTSGDTKEEVVEPPLSQNTMNVLQHDLGLENLENLVVLSQGSSQKSIGDVQVTLTVGTFEQPKIVKATPWIFSSTLRRLYLKNAVKVPFRFTCDGTYSTHMRLVVCLRYQEAHHQGEPVEVCPNHLLKNQEQKIDHPRHVLQYCGERFATYSGPPDTADFGIRIPVLQDAFSSSGQTENFSFVCLSSCMMIARKKTSLCAELHYKDQILSKVDIPLKISVCPMRDMQNEEGKCLTNTIAPYVATPKSGPPSKKARTVDNVDNNVTTAVSEIIVRVKGRKFTEELKAFLASNIPPQHYAVYQQHT